MVTCQNHSSHSSLVLVNRYGVQRLPDLNATIYKSNPRSVAVPSDTNFKVISSPDVMYDLLSII